MNAPRVAIVFRGIGDIGGTNNTIADHARALTQLGYNVDLIGEKIHKGGVTPDMGHGVRIRRLPLLKSRRWRYFADRADACVARENYNFVIGHGHNLQQSVLSMHNCLHLAHEVIHGGSLDARGTLADVHDDLFARGRFGLCICNSRLMQRDLAQRYGIDEAQLSVVYPGYRPMQFNREDRARYRSLVREELDVSDEQVIGLVSSGDFNKRGLDILIEAFAMLDERVRRRTRLLVLGKQGASGQFIEQARRAGVADRINFVGATREPERYFHALDLCVHPARLEEFGQVVQEAMACGIPTLTTQRVGAAELLPSAFFEDLAPKPDARRLSKDIQDLLMSREAREALAQVGYDAVRVNTEQENFRATLALWRRAGLAAASAA